MIDYEESFQDQAVPEYAVVLDLYGYASLYTWEDFCKKFGFTPPEYLPNYHQFWKKEDAEAYRDKQNEYTRKRIDNA